MKTRILFRAVAVVSMLTVLSCTKEIEPEITPVDTPKETVQGKTYTIIVNAEKGDPETKALTVEGNILTASWEKDEKVGVYKGEEEIGTLFAQSTGTSTTLKGSVSGDLAKDDILTLKFCSPNYADQGGTLEYIAANCDYATAEVTISKIDDNAGTIAIDDAKFKSHQAIVKFTLLQSADPTLGIKPETLSITAGSTTINVTPPDSNPTDNVVYVAIPAIAGQNVSLRAVTRGETTYGYSKPVVTFEIGKYYAITVKMSKVFLVHNESELNGANDDGNYIIFANDITWTANDPLSISGNVTIDLAGYSLTRNLSSAITDGCVISVTNKGDLKLTGGTVSGGRNTAGGGGLINKGTATISGCTFRNNIATTRGGAIWSNSSLTVENCFFIENEALAKGGTAQNEGDGGAIHLEAGTATLTDVTITDNKSKDAGGIYVMSDAILNLGGTSTIRHNISSEHGGGGIVNYGKTTLTGSVRIFENDCHTNGCGIWSNGILEMEGDIQVKNNVRDDIFLKSGKVIAITGALTGGNESIGVNMETLGVFTSSYEVNNPGNTIHFFPSGTENTMGLIDGEGKMLYGYYEASWDEANKKVVYTKKTIPQDAEVYNICSSMYAAGGNLTDSQWFVADGTGSTTSGLTCGEGERHLILCDGASITINKGFFVPEGTTLHIYCQSYKDGERMGKLISNNSESEWPGIGPKDGYMGNLVIHGGNITASIAGRAAGIGRRRDKPSGPITIYGGFIHATAGEFGAGIGGGEGGSGENITIYGGNITAQGGYRAAGIGGGWHYNGGGSCRDLVIHDGFIKATGGKYGAGIGSGESGEDVTITINDGEIHAFGGETESSGSEADGGGAGIGGGRYGGITRVTINGGKIYAIASHNGAGIGGGGHGNQSGPIIINGGVVHAIGGDGKGKNIHGGAGIGGGGHVGTGGAKGDGGEVTITGGTVYPQGGQSINGGSNGAAIGHSGSSTVTGILTIPDIYSVAAGKLAGSEEIQTAENRETACYKSIVAIIEPCEHPGYTSLDCPYHKHE